MMIGAQPFIWQWPNLERATLTQLCNIKSLSDKIDILVATDALARGIDIGKIDFVISYDCPKFVKTYIHR